MAEWRFLLDENIDPKVATYLEKADISAIHIRDSLGLGADDEADVLPYARENDRIILTSDVTDFAPLPSERHAGLVLLYDDTMPAYRVASALIALIEAYQSRERFGVEKRLTTGSETDSRAGLAEEVNEWGRPGPNRSMARDESALCAENARGAGPARSGGPAGWGGLRREHGRATSS